MMVLKLLIDVPDRIEGVSEELSAFCDQIAEAVSEDKRKDFGQRVRKFELSAGET
jgi:hypothetical protein